MSSCSQKLNVSTRPCFPNPFLCINKLDCLYTLKIKISVAGTWMYDAVADNNIQYGLMVKSINHLTILKSSSNRYPL